MCNEAGLNTQPIDDLIKALGSADEKGIDDLRELAEGCPACMLAAIRQSGLNKYVFSENVDEWGSPELIKYPIQFEYKEEKELFWREINNERAERDYRYY